MVIARDTERTIHFLDAGNADNHSLLSSGTELPIVVQADATDCGLGAVLLQQHDDELGPVAFASRTLMPLEQNYTVTEKGCLTIKLVLHKFHMHLHWYEI